jgi:putative membrane protein
MTLTVLLTFEHGWGQYAWHAHHPGWIVLGVVLSYALGYLAGTIPPFIRFFTTNERMAFKVRRRAELAFYEHGLHKTRKGTGILIMASLLERRVQVLADKAINERVPPGTWDNLVREMVQGITDGRAAEAFCQAIARCGDLLAQHCPTGPGDNPDELPDDLIREK